MNKKIIFIFSIFFIFTLLIVITMIGIVPAEFDDRKGIDELSFYYYHKDNPQEINYKTVRYLLSTDLEKKKNWQKEDISGFEKLDSTEIKFYTFDKENKIKKNRKGTLKRIFIFSKPFYGIFDGVTVEIANAKLAEDQINKKLYIKDLNDIKDKKIVTEDFSFKLCEAEPRGRSSKGILKNYLYIEIKQEKNFKEDFNEQYEIKITDIYTKKEKKLFLETNKEVFD